MIFNGISVARNYPALQLYWPLKEEFLVISQKVLRTAILWHMVARIFSYYRILNLQNFLLLINMLKMPKEKGSLLC